MIHYQFSKQTVASKFKRLAYFNGQLLTENDLLEEQEYFREKLKMHNRMHGAGVVQGLEVTTENKKDNPPIVTIHPGYALDCEGNEVIVCKPYNYDLKESIEYFKRIGAYFSDNRCTTEDCNKDEPHIVIGIMYGECSSNPSTQYMTTCTTDIQDYYSRRREGFIVAIKQEYHSSVNCCDMDNVSDICTPSSCCTGKEVDYNNNMIIPLARICIKNFGDCPIVKINDVRQYAWTFTTHNKWEQARKKLIQPDIKVVHNISFIVNMNIKEAKRVLGYLNIIVNHDTLVSSKLTNEQWTNVNKMSPLVPEGSKITLITYDDGEMVRFGITNENTSGQD